jgi:5-oxoprolinase (ATP-hydrolysing) subunit B
VLAVAHTALRMSAAGVGGLLLDPSRNGFDTALQERLIALQDLLHRPEHRSLGVRHAVPGMNNLLLLFDPLKLPPASAEALAASLWKNARPQHLGGRTLVFDAVYGGERGPDLAESAQRLGMTVDDLVRVHSGASYMVAAIGAMPGFAYMSGLPESLHLKRRSEPRLNLAAGSVIIAGGQASVLPMNGPCGWHAIGHVDVALFDVHAASPCLLRPGDTVRFNVSKVIA